MSIDRGQQFSDEVPEVHPQQGLLPGTEHAVPHYDFTDPKYKGRVHPEHQLSISMPHTALISAIDENRFRNAWEVNTGSHSDPEYLFNRKMGEQRVFGIPEEAGAEKRPVYGLLRQKETLDYPRNDTPAAPEYTKERLYGNTLVDIKPPTSRQHVTASWEDSLDRTILEDKTVKADRLTPTSHAPRSPEDYTEVQWHDRPIPKTDIEAVHLSDDPMRGRQFIPTDIVGGVGHKAAVSEGRANAEQLARDLRLSGLRAPVYHWQKNVRYQPSLFEAEGIKGKRTEDWSRRQV